MTSRIDRMEEAGLVRRLPDRNDRRGVLVELTDKGHQVIDRTIDAHLELYARPTCGRRGLTHRLDR
jgi:DNA-binding MarR family transcriptional regulator